MAKTFLILKDFYFIQRPKYAAGKDFSVLNDLYFIQNPTHNAYKKIDQNIDFGTAELCINIITSQLNAYRCNVDTSTGYRNIVQYPEYYFREQIAILNQNLSDQLANQINSIIDLVNMTVTSTDQARAMFYKFFNKGNQSALNDFVEDYRNFSVEYLVPIEFSQDYKHIAYKKYSFCGDTPNITTNNSEEFIFSTPFFSICSWKISEETPLLDPETFFITIIFSVYDKQQHEYFDVKLNITTPTWIVEECKKRSLTFFRHTLIQEYFDLETIKHHVYRTLIHSQDQDYASSVHKLSFGFNLPENYIAIGQHDRTLIDTEHFPSSLA